MNSALLFSGAWEAALTVGGSLEMWSLVLLGTFLGMTIGVLPGFGPPAAMALLFPLAYVLDALPAMALLTVNFLRRLITGHVTMPDEVLSCQPLRLIGFLYYQPHSTGS